MSRQIAPRPQSTFWEIVDSWFRPATGRVGTRRRTGGVRRSFAFESLEGRTVLSASPGAIIQGTAFNDMSGNGLTADDTRLQGITVELFKDGGNGTFQGSAAGSDDTMVGSQVTDAAGHYSFSGLDAGTYFAEEITPAGYALLNANPLTITISSLAAQGTAGPVIDSFNTTSQTVDASSVGSTMAANSMAAPEAIGGHRDLVAQLTSQFGDVSLNANAFNQHVLEFNSSATGAGNREIDWDGNNANPGVLNPTGLNHTDLTGGGVATGIQFTMGADHDSGTLTINIYKDASNWSTATVAIPNTGGQDLTGVFVPFSSFTVGGGSGAGSFSDVGAIQMKITGSAAVNGQIDGISTLGPTVFTSDFANYQPASVGQTAFWDLNKDGIHEAGEPGAAGVQVTLTPASGPNQTTTTDAQGHYQFTGLAPGNYVVQFVTPHGSLFTLENQGADNTANSGVDPASGVTPVFSLLSGQNDITRNAGLIPINLSLTKTIDNSTPLVGNNVQFTVTVSNAGNLSQATGVAVTDVLPAGLTYVSSTPAQGSFNSSTGVWTVGSLASGASTSLTIVATVTTGGVKTNTAEVTAADEVDLNSTPNNHNPNEDDQASVSLTPILPVDLLLTKTVDNTTPNVGQNVVFTQTLTDLGPGNATGVAVTDHLPAGLTYVSSTASQGSYNPATGIWTVGSVNTGGQPITLQITATVATPGSKTNTATITSEDQPDTNLQNNQGSATVTPPEADLSVTKTVDDSTPSLNQNVTFTVTVSNAGPNTATNTVLSDVLPAGLTYVSSTASQGSYNPATGAWSIGSLASGAPAVTLHITATVVTSGNKTNEATVTADQFDPTLENNTADASLTPTASVGTFVFWDLNGNGIRDSGEPGASGVTVTLTPAGGGTSLTTTTDSQGNYSFTGLAPGDYTIQFNGTSGAKFTLANQGTDPTINSNVSPNTGSTPIFNLASGQNDPTRDAGLLPVDLQLTKTVDNSAPFVGGTVHFTVTVTNAPSASQATGVVVHDLLPAGLVFISASPSQGTYDSTSGVWTVGDLAGGDSVQMVVTAKVTSTGTKTNTAQVTATDEVDIAPAAALIDSADLTPNAEPPLSKALFLGR